MYEIPIRARLDREAEAGALHNLPQAAATPANNE
jgi:hypothetical protein